eukprot:170702_1
MSKALHRTLNRRSWLWAQTMNDFEELEAKEFEAAQVELLSAFGGLRNLITCALKEEKNTSQETLQSVSSVIDKYKVKHTTKELNLRTVSRNDLCLIYSFLDQSDRVNLCQCNMSFFAFSKTINSSFGRILKLVPSFKDSSDPQFTLYYLNKIIKELRFNSKAINILKDYELVGVLLPKLRDLITDNASKWNAQSTAQKHCIIAALECIVILKSSDKYNNMEWEAFMDDEFLQSLFDIIRIKETLNDELHSAHTQALIVHSIYYKQSTDQMIKNAIHETVLHNVVQWHTYNPSNLELVICALRVLRECYAKDAIKNAKEIQQKLMDIVIHLLNGLRTYLCDGWKTEVCKGLIVKVNKKPKPKKRDHRSGYGVSYSTNSKETNKSYYIKRVIHDSAYLDQNTAKKAPQQNDNNTITYSYMSMNRSTDEESKESDSEDDMKTIDGAWLELKEMQSDGFRRQQVKGYVNKKLHHKSIQLAGNQQTATLFTQLLDLLSFCMQLGGDQRLDLRSLGIMDTVQYLMKNAGKSGRQNDGDIPIVHRLIALDATIVLHDIVTDHNSALFKSFANAAIQQGLNDELFDQCVRKICGDECWSSSYFSYSSLDDKKTVRFKHAIIDLLKGIRPEVGWFYAWRSKRTINIQNGVRRVTDRYCCSAILNIVSCSVFVVQTLIISK